LATLTTTAGISLGGNMTKDKLVELLNRVLKTRRATDNYIDGVLDMYNAMLKEIGDIE
jgi:hypothetical protein